MMFENRQYDKPALVEYEGVLEKHRNKSPTADGTFFEWCRNNSEKYSSFHTMALALGLKGKTLEKLCERNGVTLVFDSKAKNTPKPYQNREWLYEQKIIMNKTNKEIALENGWTVRVVEKWVQLFKLGKRDFKKEKTLSSKQLSLIKGSVLGDGHIAHNNSFIVSHSEKQKEYLFWKYEVLKDLCSSPPSYYDKTKKYFSNGKEYDCLAFYRFNTRLLLCLKEIREASKASIINSLDEMGIAIWFLDDGNREPCNWRLCIAALNEEEKKVTINKFFEMGIASHLCKDTRYLFLPAKGTKVIDEIILNNIPNNIDVVRDKVLNKRR